jgi:hypothetical protein
MLEHQRAFDSIGKGVMQELGSAMDGAGVMRMARGGMKSQLLEGADVMRALGVVKSQGLMTGVDVSGIARGVVKSEDLLNRAGLRDVLKDTNVGAGRVAMQSGAARASRATAGLTAARVLSGQVGQDITRWTSSLREGSLAAARERGLLALTRSSYRSGEVMPEATSRVRCARLPEAASADSRGRRPQRLRPTWPHRSRLGRGAVQRAQTSDPKPGLADRLGRKADVPLARIHRSGGWAWGSRGGSCERRVGGGRVLRVAVVVLAAAWSRGG